MSATHATSIPQKAPPKRILLATDLSMRCDRAQERAVRLAEEWGATLYVLHVLAGREPLEVPSWRRGQSRVEEAAERHIREDLQGRPVTFEVRMARGDPAQAILQQAEELDCQLIVTGVARNEMLGRFSLGAVVEVLIRKSPVPVLVVKGRAWQPYTEIMVATDYSEPSRQALASALHLFPAAAVTLIHAYVVPFEGFISRDANIEDVREAAETEQAEFMDSVKDLPGMSDRVRILLEYGGSESVLCNYAHDQRIPLAVIGTQGRSGMAGFLVGSTAKRLLSCLPCDVLVVRQSAG